MAFKLADLFVQFSAAGVDVLTKTLAGVKAQLEKVRDGAEEVGKAAVSGFNKAQSALITLTRAGLAGTVQGEALALRLQLIGREIASVFVPQIQAAVAGLGKLVEVMRSLNGEQQANLAGWLLGAAGAFKFATALGGILGPIGAIVGALTGLFIGLEVGKNGFAGLLAVFQPVFDAIREGFAQLQPQISALVTELQPLINAFIRLTTISIREVFGALTEALKALVPILRFVVEQFRLLTESILPDNFFKPLTPPSQQQEPRTRTDVTPAKTGFESVQDSFRRIQQAALRQDLESDVPKKQLEKLGFMDEKLGFIATAVRLKKPVFTD